MRKKLSSNGGRRQRYVELAVVRRHGPPDAALRACLQIVAKVTGVQVIWAGVRTRVRSGHRALSSRYEPVQHLADLPPRPRLELILERHRGLDDEPCAGLDAMPLSRALQMSKRET